MVFFDDNNGLSVSQDLVAAAVASARGYGPANHLKFLLERANDVEISTEIFKSVKSPNALKLLLQHQSRCAITPDILETLAHAYPHGTKLIKILLDQEPQALPTSSVIVSVVQRSQSLDPSNRNIADLLQLLLNRNPDIEISESMLLAAQRPEPLQILLSRAPGFPIRSELMQSVVSQEYIGDKLVKVILAHDKSLRIDQESLNACLEKGSPACLELILENNLELALPLELILGRIKSLRKFEKSIASEMLQVLVRHGKQQVFTPEIHRAVQEQFQMQSESDIKQLFLGLEQRD